MIKKFHTLRFAEFCVIFSVLDQSDIIVQSGCTKNFTITFDTYVASSLVFKMRFEVLCVYWTLSDVFNYRMSGGVLYHNIQYWANGDSRLPR